MKKIFSLALIGALNNGSRAWPTSKLHLNQPSHAGAAGIVRAADHGARWLLWNACCERLAHCGKHGG